MKKAAKSALIKTIPMLLGYIFLGIVFGLLLQKSGLSMFWAFLIGTLVYAGSMQFALVGTPIGDLGYVTAAVTTLFISSHHAFYELAFIKRFKKMRKAHPYMVFSLTDGTYSLLYSMAHPPAFTGKEQKATTFFTALLDQCYWIAGSVLSVPIGKLITSDTIDIDLAMTALFVIIYVDQWKAAETHILAITGFMCGALSLVLVRSSNFILPALTAVVAMLLFLRKIVERKMGGD